MACRQSQRKPLLACERHSGLRTCLGQGRLPAQVMEHGSPAQGKVQAIGVRHLLGQGESLLAAGQRLVRIPEEPEGRAAIIDNTLQSRGHCRAQYGYSAAEAQRAASPVPGGAGRRRARPKQAGPQDMVGPSRRSGSCTRWARLRHCSPAPASSDIRPRLIQRPQAPQHREELRCLPHLLTQLARSGIGRSTSGAAWPLVTSNAAPRVICSVSSCWMRSGVSGRSFE